MMDEQVHYYLCSVSAQPIKLSVSILGEVGLEPGMVGTNLNSLNLTLFFLYQKLLYLFIIN